MTMFITVCVIIVIGIVVAVVMDRIMRTHDTLHEACSRTRRGERRVSRGDRKLKPIRFGSFGHSHSSAVTDF